MHMLISKKKFNIRPNLLIIIITIKIKGVKDFHSRIMQLAHQSQFYVVKAFFFSNFVHA